MGRTFTLLSGGSRILGGGWPNHAHQVSTVRKQVQQRRLTYFSLLTGRRCFFVHSTVTKPTPIERLMLATPQLMCLKSNTFQLDSSSTMNSWSLVVDINFTLGLVCPITFASLQARVRLYTGVSVHGGKLTGTSYGGGGVAGPFGPPSESAPGYRGGQEEHVRRPFCPP